MKRTLFILLIIMATLFLMPARLGAAQVDSEQVWITPCTPPDAIDMTDMTLYWQNDNLQFPADPNAKLSLYVNAQKDADGYFMFDDGQDWLLIMETASGDYPLFPRQFVQLGKVSCTSLIDTSDVYHVLVTIKQSAAYAVYDCVYNSEKQAFERVILFDFSGINLIGGSD